MKNNIPNETHDGKTCSICGNWYIDSEYEYGNRKNRSYCQQCDKEEKAAYSCGGIESARKYREKMRAKWQSNSN